MASLSARALLLLVAVWFCVAESQDGVEPLTLLEVDPTTSAEGDATSATQKALANLQYEAQKKAEEHSKMVADAAAAKAELNTVEVATEAAIAAPQPSQQSDAEAKPVLKKGLDVVDQANVENAKLKEELAQAHTNAAKLEMESFKTKVQETVLAIQQKYERLEAQEPVPDQYTAIPFFVYKTLAKQVEAQTQEKCEAVCSAQRKCKSFSFDAKDGACWWSVAKLNYDDDYFYSAKRSQGGWADTPGLKWSTPLSNHLYKVSLEQCRDSCTEDGASCTAISYKSSSKTCIRSGEALETSQHATYYEKTAGKYDREMAADIAKAKSKLEASFKAKEGAQKTRLREEQASQAREGAAKQKTRENYAKSLPSKSQELKIKNTAQSQVEQEKIALEENTVKAEEKAELKSRASAELAKENSLKQLQRTESQQVTAENALHTAKIDLNHAQGELEASEGHASKLTDILDKDLRQVRKAHDRAMKALMAFNEAKGNANTDPEVLVNSRLEMETLHTDLSTAIHQAEYAHTDEVKAKTQLQADIAAETNAAQRLNSAKARLASQKNKDQAAVETASKSTAKAKLDAARQAYDKANNSFNTLKANERQEKQKQAEAAGREAAAAEQLKAAPAGDTSHLEDMKTAAREENAHAKQALTQMAQAFKQAFVRVSEAKERYHAVKSEIEGKHKGKTMTQDQKIAAAKQQLMTAANGNL